MYSALKACSSSPSSSARATASLPCISQQRKDLAQVLARIDALGLQALAVGLGARRQGQELHQQSLLACAFALGHELLRVLGQFDVLMPIHAAHMARHELVTVIDAHPIGIGF